MTSIPKQSPIFWLVLWVSLAFVLAVTALKDGWLTAQAPNLAFYILIPIIHIASEALVIWAAARTSHQAVAFLDVLAVIVGSMIIMQFTEILLKLVYYLVWQYPAILYLLITIILNLGIVGYCLYRWCRVSLRTALFLALLGLLGSSAITALFTSVTGIVTPGS